jgi:Fe-S-cluster containining protein
MSFPCTRCGQCCLHIANIAALTSFHNGDGKCLHYDVRVGCVIYATRPDVCRIDDGYLNFFADSMSLTDYYQANATVCNQLQQDNGISQHYRVILL